MRMLNNHNLKLGIPHQNSASAPTLGWFYVSSSLSMERSFDAPAIWNSLE